MVDKIYVVRMEPKSRNFKSNKLLILQLTVISLYHEKKNKAKQERIKILEKEDPELTPSHEYTKSYNYLQTTISENKLKNSRTDHTQLRIYIYKKKKSQRARRRGRDVVWSGTTLLVHCATEKGISEPTRALPEDGGLQATHQAPKLRGSASER